MSCNYNCLDGWKCPAPCWEEDDEMGKSQRDKGKRIEREAAELLRPVYPEVRRSANQAGIEVIE